MKRALPAGLIAAVVWPLGIWLLAEAFLQQTPGRSTASFTALGLSLIGFFGWPFVVGVSALLASRVRGRTWWVPALACSLGTTFAALLLTLAFVA